MAVKPDLATSDSRFNREYQRSKLVKAGLERIGLVLGMLFLSAFAMTARAETKEEIWNTGWVSLPPSITKCSSGLIKNLKGNCSNKKLPAVVFMHGRTGLNGSQFAHMDMFAQLGYPVFAPNSYARPGRQPIMGFGATAGWRMEEIRIALDKLKTLSWVDQNKLIIAGHSQGGKAVAEYSGDEFRAHIGMSFGCEGYTTRFNAPSNIAALHINGENDLFLNDNSLCSEGGRKKFKSAYVNTGHVGLGDPNTILIISKFLADCCGYKRVSSATAGQDAEATAKKLVEEIGGLATLDARMKADEALGKADEEGHKFWMRVHDIAMKMVEG